MHIYQMHVMRAWYIRGMQWCTIRFPVWFGIDPVGPKAVFRALALVQRAVREAARALGKGMGVPDPANRRERPAQRAQRARPGRPGSPNPDFVHEGWSPSRQTYGLLLLLLFLLADIKDTRQPSTHPHLTSSLTPSLTVNPSDCATSFSWCGKTRSMPPACTSTVSPRNRRAMALHSMCHPGRPFPIGVSQNTSPSSGLYAWGRGQIAPSGRAERGKGREPEGAGKRVYHALVCFACQ